MLYEYLSDEVYVFLYNSIDDVPCFADYCFDTLEEAEEMCLEGYNISKSGWINIDNPTRHCQDDIISPVRVKGRDLGKPQWGNFEKLVNGKWVEYKFYNK